MAVVQTNVTAPEQPVYTFSSVQVAQLLNVKPLRVSSRGNIGFGQRLSDGALMETPDEGATWNLVNLFSQRAIALIETNNGEVIVLIAVGAGYPAGGNQIWYSTGWASGHATATWTRANMTDGITPFSSNGGIKFEWGFSQQALASGGTILINEYGAQSNAANAARYIYRSDDHGHTWRIVYDVSAGVGGLHMHASRVSLLDNSLYFTFGDADAGVTKAGGSGKFALGRYDIDTEAVSYFTLPADFSDYLPGARIMQDTGVDINERGDITLTPDGPPYAMAVFTRTGLRTFANYNTGPAFSVPNTATIGGGLVKYKSGDPTLAAYDLDGSQSVPVATPAFPRLFARPPGSLDWQTIWEDPTNQILSSANYISVVPVGIFASGKVMAFYNFTNGGAWANGALLTGTLTGPA